MHGTVEDRCRRPRTGGVECLEFGDAAERLHRFGASGSPESLDGPGWASEDKVLALPESTEPFWFSLQLADSTQGCMKRAGLEEVRASGAQLPAPRREFCSRQQIILATTRDTPLAEES